MELHYILLENLTVATINARTHGATDNLDSLAASIKAQGLLQPLLVRSVADSEGFEIVAGQRRFLACQRLAQEQPIEPLPCWVLDATDDAAALEISLAENLERLPMEPFDQHEAFAQLVRRGQGVATLAARFGVTERLVKQRLALAHLSDAIKREARKGAVSLADAQVLALATPKQQKAWFKLYRNQEQYAPQGSQLKAWLCGGAAISTEVALFPLESYTGRIVADLFGEESYFDDAAQFWTLQHQAIAALRNQRLAEGWAKVEVLETGEYFRSWEYQRTSKQQGGWILIGPHSTGEVVCHEGFLPLKEARRQARPTARLEGEAANEAPKATRSEAAQALQNYLALHKAAAVRYQLTQNPALALRLAVASLIGGATNWSVRTDRTAPHGPAIEASVAKGVALDRFREEEATVKAWIGASGDRDWVGGIGGEGQTAEAFGRLLELSDEQVLKVLAVVVAETLVAGSGWAEQMGERLQIDMRRFWKPDETFFDLLTDKEALVRIAVEVGAAPSGKATGKELRGLIRHRVKGEGCAPVENWLPRYFEFPTQGYTARPVSEARTAYDRLARRGSGANPEAEDDAVFEDEETDGQADEADEADEAGVEWDEAA
ncbi:MAG: ParB/RepB/Spo0J family partition protein [Candidatus Competibacteraceae bacterium]|nr:ParB/RepB/Spo0J family partition protein [Candidatus Competibacteraceae bacterium]